MDHPLHSEQILAYSQYLRAEERSSGGGAGLDRFSDAGSVSGYAGDAMSWAGGTGIINGRGDGSLDPQGNATRAQVADTVFTPSTVSYIAINLFYILPEHSRAATARVWRRISWFSYSMTSLVRIQVLCS